MAAQVQIVKDTGDAAIVRLTFTSAGSQESGVVKVDPATLANRAYTLAVNSNTSLWSVGSNGFVPGEYVRNANAALFSAQVISFDPIAALFTLINVTDAGHANGDIVVGSLTRNQVPLLAAAANATPAILDIESIAYAVTGNGTVSVTFLGANSNVATAAVLSGSGYFGKNALATIITPAANNDANAAFTANGQIAVTTSGIPSGGGYTILLELRKTRGFAFVPDERVVEGT
jgi:hypothetical protein